MLKLIGLYKVTRKPAIANVSCKSSRST